MDEKELKIKTAEQPEEAVSATEKRMKAVRLMTVIMLALGAAAAIAYCVMAILLFEPDIRYFKYGAVPVVIYVVFAVVFCVCAFVLGGVTPKNAELADYNGRRGVYGIAQSALAGLAAAAIAVWEIQEALRFSSLPEAIGDADIYKRYSIVLGIAVITGVFAVIYFALCAIPGGKLDRVRSAFGFVTVLFFVARLLVLYYDVSAPINSPLRIIDQMANVSGMLFVTAEIRFRLGDPRPRFYRSISIIAVHLLAAASITRIALKIGGIIDFEMPAFAYVFELLLAAYAALRLLGITLTPRVKSASDSDFEEYPYDPRYSPSGNPYADLDESDPRYVPPEKLGGGKGGSRGND